MIGPDRVAWQTSVVKNVRSDAVAGHFDSPTKNVPFGRCRKMCRLADAEILRVL